MIKIAIILGSTRPNRVGEAVARWAFNVASKRVDATFEMIDLLDVSLPFLDEPAPPSFGHYANQHTKDWSAKIAEFDAYIFVTPEYNHSIPAALKNAIDFLYTEWNNKVAGFISYGGNGGVRAVEHLRLVMAELQVADVREHLALSLFTDFESYSIFRPIPFHENKLTAMVDQVVTWGTAFKRFVRNQNG